MGKLTSVLIFTIIVTGILFANAALVLKKQIEVRNMELTQTIAGANK